MIEEKIERIKNLVDDCNRLADDKVFTYKVTEIFDDCYSIEIKCKNTAYRNELRTLVTLIDMMNPILDESECFVQLH